MWSARGAYRDKDGKIIRLPERSPLWISKEGLLRQIKKDHPEIAFSQFGNWHSWIDEDGVERFVIIGKE